MLVFCVERPCAKEGEEATGDGDDDPVVSSMTISYTLPDGTEFTSPEPCVVARKSGPVPVAFESPEHALKVDEGLLRKLAECPRLSVTFTRDGPVDEETGESVWELPEGAPAAQLPPGISVAN